jgi:hypothetical protein
MTPTDDLQDLARVFHEIAREAWDRGETDTAWQWRRAAGMARYLADNPGAYGKAVVPMPPGADAKGGAA